MSISVSFGQVVPKAVDYVAQVMRGSDVDEVWASRKMDPKQALVTSIMASEWSAVMWIDQQIVGIVGFVKVANDSNRDYGIPWFLGTHDLEKYPVSFVKSGKKVIAHMMTLVPYLENYVSAENITSIEFLKHMGFTIEEPQPVGVEGELFHKFHMGVEPCVILSLH